MNVNGYDVAALKEATIRQNLTWRSFADPGVIGRGAITTAWNVSAIPTLYLIDHQGIIRHKWLGSPGEETIDAALDAMLAEVEASGR